MPNVTPFEKLFDELDSLNELLDDGPEDGSADFLAEVQLATKQINEKALALTEADVDAEFTEEETDEGKTE